MRAKNFVNGYLASSSCVDCGETDPVVLHFDHVRGEKIKAVSYMIYHEFSLCRIVLEIEKCDVRCANCHYRRHARLAER